MRLIVWRRRQNKVLKVVVVVVSIVRWQGEKTCDRGTIAGEYQKRSKVERPLQSGDVSPSNIFHTRQKHICPKAFVTSYMTSATGRDSVELNLGTSPPTPDLFRWSLKTIPQHETMPPPLLCHLSLSCLDLEEETYLSPYRRPPAFPMGYIPKSFKTHMSKAQESTVQT